MHIVFLFLFAIWLISILIYIAVWLIANVLWWALPLGYAAYKAYDVISYKWGVYQTEKALEKAEEDAAQRLRDEFEETKRWMRQSVRDRAWS